MNEPTLAKTIDRAALSRAEKIIDNFKISIINALDNKWRQKEASNELLRDDVINVLENYLVYLKTSGQPHPKSPKPTDALINGCRAKILNDLIDGLPKINDLLSMLPQETTE